MTDFDRELIQRYDLPGPRYTSYPTALQFQPPFGEADYVALMGEASERAPARPLSLYVHLPFCSTLCWYCACNKIVTRDRGVASPYLDHLTQEIRRHAALCSAGRVVEQMHWGGGTPTFVGDEGVKRLMKAIRGAFDFAPAGAELGTEVDPRQLGEDTLAVLAEIGFNRLSIGVQDFDPRVQKAVHRLQPLACTWVALGEARRCGFASISIDLIYGLPLQSRASMNETLAHVVELDPDRVALYNYAHLPSRFPAQRRIRLEDLPSPAEKLDMLEMAVERLSEAGYIYIGMDHFAKAHDELAKALREGTLQRNFQGYSTRAGTDLIGVGMSAIGALECAYFQNEKELPAYYAALDAERLPIARGLRLDFEDRLRRAVIMALICRFELDFAGIEREFAVDFRRHFAPELGRLAHMEGDGLVTLNERGIRVTDRGRFLVRNVCMTFDRYLTAGAEGPRYSRVI